MTSEAKQAAASHPNYVLIWGILVSALLVSLFLGYMDLPVVAMVLIFTIAIVKAWLVIAYYMHLKYEPFFVVAIVATGLACLYFLFIGLVPDIVFAPSKGGAP
jgi:caa(3)-type oxidase subunit IV